MKKLEGLTIVSGYAYGDALVYKNTFKDRQQGSVEEEKKEFEKAVGELEKILEQRKNESTGEVKEITEAHLMMLEDVEFTDRVNANLEREMSFEQAVTLASKELSDMLASLDDEYLKARAADVLDIAEQLKHQEKLDVRDKILIKEEIFPSEVIEYSKQGVKAFLSQKGSVTSHASILAKNAGIVYITALSEDIFNFSGEIYVDGFDGFVCQALIQDEIDEFLLKERNYRKKKEELDKLIGMEGHSKDGLKRMICANVSDYDGLVDAMKKGAEGIALYRTEFLFMEENLPSIERQVEVYTKMAKEMNSKHFVIRTMDLGADKVHPDLTTKDEENPFLGLRGIRLSFNKKEVFKNQLKAILITADDYKLHVMFPMITCIEDIQEAKALVDEAAKELAEQGINYKIPTIGIMLEVPMMLGMLKDIEDMVDFISIGTNDLLQYISASDRMNSEVLRWYNPYLPGFLRLLWYGLKDIKKMNIAMCGDLAQDENLVPLFSAMGVSEFGVPASRVTAIKDVVSKHDAKDKIDWIEDVLSAKTEKELREKLS